MPTIGERIRELRIKKGLSQGDIEKASGLLKCYISRCGAGAHGAVARNPGTLCQRPGRPVLQAILQWRRRPRLAADATPNP